ncbi:CDP-glycerol glycerophosphotransferase family protein [Streptomyces flavalbus]|uniref:CDP-glycerol glycerophosphotransferase family protein n=1 Tax=Streptomyces flavalbus TaxID=2665155 RepID=A0ABW2W698_9ACTN
MRGKADLLLVFLFGASFAALPVFALLPSLWGFVAAAAVSYVTDEMLHSRAPGFIRRLASLQLTRTMRFAARMVMLLALAQRMGASATVLVVGLAAFSVHFAIVMMYSAVHRAIRVRRTLPVMVRNLDMSGAGIPKQPPATLYRRFLRKLLHLDVPAQAGLLTALVVDSVYPAYAGFAAMTALAALALVALLWQLRRATRTPGPDEMIAALNEQLAGYRPEVALYFSFAAVSRDFMYQVNMWIETLEQLDMRPLIILRERASFRYLSRTWIPVVCVPKADDVAKLELPEVRVVLYPGNAGKNVHMLRVAEAKHVFIGHGDSDKLASSNRVSKVYDEIWVAGRAGRDRYQRVRHAISDSAIVEVGRPQLAPIKLHADHTPGPEPVVLYAPTWEGWSDDDCHTSLIPMGVTLVEKLLQENVRVIYKPHPLTGKRSREAAAADQAIKEMLQADNARHGGAKAEAAIAAARTRLQQIEDRLDELAGQAEGDDAEQTRLARVPDRDGGTEWQDLNDEWHRVFWESHAAARHHVILKRLPTLYECFNQADILISDVSSVVADFVASLKPYVLTNAHDLPDDEFRAAYTTAGGAYLLDSACERLPEILRSVREPRHDPMADSRRTLKEYVLGPDRPTSMARFNAAALALAEKGRAELAEGPGEGHRPVVIPSQRTDSFNMPDSVEASAYQQSDGSDSGEQADPADLVVGLVDPAG